MSYEQTTDTDSVTEWTRDDGTASIRLRERPDGQFVVRYDQLHQAETGRAYACQLPRGQAPRLVSGLPL